MKRSILSFLFSPADAAAIAVGRRHTCSDTIFLPLMCAIILYYYIIIVVLYFFFFFFLFNLLLALAFEI